ncbi:hypothetical protein ABAC402_10440 [Asticcacaulis sp. AC402]|nr:hypothetical protein ABAC402_10440 [Asticcacaulis sp. AC402]
MLRAWLVQHNTQTTGIWLVSARAHATGYIGYDRIVEELLCFGWIDSLPRKLDENRTMLYIAPRKPGSNWSRLNKDRVDKLIAAGRMTDVGLACVSAAKLDGSWTALDDVEAGVIPPDLQAALEQHGDALSHFSAFPKSVKRGILEWIQNARTPQTRLRRITETAEQAAVNRRANQYQQPADRHV